MGKRKSSSRKVRGTVRDGVLIPYQKASLSTKFQCVFCNHGEAVSVKMDKKSGIGELSCRVCGQKFQSGINYLSEPIDVYSDWVDACDAVAQEAAKSAADKHAADKHPEQSHHVY